MKKLFIEVKSDVKINLPESEIAKLPKKLGLISTVQFLEQMQYTREILEGAGKKCIVGEGTQPNAGQVLGCDASAADKIASKVDAFLYIGDGNFHPVAVRLSTGKDVYVLDPYKNTITELCDADLELYEKRKKAAMTKFAVSKNIGIIVTTKPGQNKIEQAEKLKASLKDENCYIFICDNLDFSQLENFNFIDCWVNTACPRIAIDDYDKFNKPVINIEDIR